MIQCRGTKGKFKPCAHSPEEVSSIRLHYELHFDEVYEALLLIIDRRRVNSRRCMGIFLFLLALVCVVLYGRTPYGIQFALMALLFAVFSFLVLAYPQLKAQTGARAIIRRGGRYQIELLSDGWIALPNGDQVDLAGDKSGRTLETRELFALRPDRLHTLCIPKRILNDGQTQQIRQILTTYSRTYHFVEHAVKVPVKNNTQRL